MLLNKAYNNWSLPMDDITVDNPAAIFSDLAKISTSVSDTIVASLNASLFFDSDEKIQSDMHPLHNLVYSTRQIIADDIGSKLLFHSAGRARMWYVSPVAPFDYQYNQEQTYIGEIDTNDYITIDEFMVDNHLVFHFINEPSEYPETVDIDVIKGVGNGLPFGNLFPTYEDWNLLDYDFIGKYGQRESAPLVDNLIDLQAAEKNYLTSSSRLKLAKIIYRKYINQWTKLWDTFLLEKPELSFNPIENYDRYEEFGGQDESTTTPDHYKTTTSAAANNNQDITENETYGFNSSNGVKDNKYTTSHSVNTEVEQSGSLGTLTQYGRENHIHGNIGVTTAVQMLTEYQNYFIKADYFNRIQADVAKEISIYLYN